MVTSWNSIFLAFFFVICFGMCFCLHLKGTTCFRYENKRERAEHLLCSALCTLIFRFRTGSQRFSPPSSSEKPPCHKALHDARAQTQDRFQVRAGDISSVRHHRLRERSCPAGRDSRPEQDPEKSY